MTTTPLKELTDKDISSMTKVELSERLHKLNPFAGYSPEMPRFYLMQTMKNYRNKANSYDVSH